MTVKEMFLGNSKNKARAIARIGILMALTVLAQYLTGLAGIQLLTGSIVNMFIILSVSLCGVVGGIAVGVVTPFIALAVGINPNWLLVPFIALSNAMYAMVFGTLAFVLSKLSDKVTLKMTFCAIAMVIGAALKYLFMFFVCVKLIFPLFLAEKMVGNLANAWGILQLFTALIGGAVALGLCVPLRKILRLNEID